VKRKGDFAYLKHGKEISTAYAAGNENERAEISAGIDDEEPE
jgi:hypothetical protein